MNPKEQSSSQIYLRLLKDYVRPYWRAFSLAILCMVLSSLAEPALPALLKYLLDDGFNAKGEGFGWLIYPAGIFLVFVLRAIVGYLADYLLAWVSQNVITEMRRQMFARLIQLPTQYFNDQSSGRLLSRVANDVSGVANASTNALTTLIKDTVSVFGLLAWLFYLNWQLTLITIAMIPFIALAVRYFSRRIRQITRNIQSSQGEITQVLQEAIEGHKIIKVFGGQRYEIDRFDAVIRGQRRLQMRATMSNAALGPIVQFFAVFALSSIMGIALFQAAQGQATVGDFISFITATMMTLAPLKRLTGVNVNIQTGVVAAESVFSLVDQTGEPDTGQGELGRAAGKIEFDQVCFTYPDSNRAAVDDVSFVLQPGDSVALVGSSGSGKTTIASLLPRFIIPDSGQIRIDGHDISAVRLASLRANIALVSQEIVLFNDTLAANIAYGCAERVARDDIIAAATAAHAMEFIERLPDGLDTLVGERGVKLSGGQRQRLAIARAIMKKAPILILDEATSALDTESERHVQAALEALMRGCTTLVIAHRLSTIEKADRIIVMHQGRIAETGTHTQLLAKQGTYARLHQVQFDLGRSTVLDAEA
jgi:subfamily B ATP-binding cassette protein MsbA